MYKDRVKHIGEGVMVYTKDYSTRRDGNVTLRELGVTILCAAVLVGLMTWGLGMF